MVCGRLLELIKSAFALSFRTNVPSIYTVACACFAAAPRRSQAVLEIKRALNRALTKSRGQNQCQRQKEYSRLPITILRYQYLEPLAMKLIANRQNLPQCSYCLGAEFFFLIVDPWSYPIAARNLWGLKRHFRRRKHRTFLSQDKQYDIGVVSVCRVFLSQALHLRCTHDGPPVKKLMKRRHQVTRSPGYPEIWTLGAGVAFV